MQYVLRNKLAIYFVPHYFTCFLIIFKNYVIKDMI